MAVTYSDRVCFKSLFLTVQLDNASLQGAEFLSLREKFPVIPEKNRNLSGSSTSSTESQRPKTRFRIGSVESGIYFNTLSDPQFREEAATAPKDSVSSDSTLVNSPKDFNFETSTTENVGDADEIVLSQVRRDDRCHR